VLDNAWTAAAAVDPVRHTHPAENTSDSSLWDMGKSRSVMWNTRRWLAVVTAVAAATLLLAQPGIVVGVAVLVVIAGIGVAVETRR
jgi:fatty acid desaturase